MFQPDNRIGKSVARSVIGNDTYNTTGSGQKLNLVSKKGRRVRGVLTLENDGDGRDRFGLVGRRGSRIFRVKYLSASQGNGTAQVVAGSFRTGVMEPGAPAEIITTVIKPKRNRIKKRAGKGRNARIKWLKKRYTVFLNSTSEAIGENADRTLVRIRTR